ncbi:MAG: two-component sensor histidine kinase [Hyphomicrobiales bacterium]|nr:two-component sensor histidine kinase [Hyphomicrobiales bacterium]
MSETRTIAAALVSSLPFPAVLVEQAGRIIIANSPALALFPGLRAGLPLALSLRAPDVLDAMARARQDGSGHHVLWQERVPLERVFDVHVAPVSGLSGDPFLVLAFRDLTAERRVERMRVDFVANASHELRTPLASLIGFIDTLQGAARDDSVARERFLGLMHEQARRMARLVDDLLSLSQIEQTLHLQPADKVDLADVVGYIADTLSSMAEERSVTLKLALAEDVQVPGERDELARVAENLIENAIKYGGEGGEVYVDVAREGRQALLSVRDKGPGIAPEHLPRLTERFYRVDVGQSRSKGGTGLGLAIVKHIVARHRGRLEIDSAPGEGASFSVLLPLFANGAG